MKKIKAVFILVLIVGLASGCGARIRQTVIEPGLCLGSGCYEPLEECDFAMSNVPCCSSGYYDSEGALTCQSIYE